ncbi:unnamed protein product [Brassica napus]|uniref:(rape) hypothetical protein n=1 Tax=Brassica napus TaxID=3708 RepID=A0A816I958_BRANA|nr:unnamed protein product [Brassica napus]
MAQKVEAQGGKGGIQWDDGYEHDAVTKIPVGAGGIGIQYINFDYVKNGQAEEAPLPGVKGRSIAADPKVGFTLIQGLKFISNKKTSDVIGYDDAYFAPLTSTPLTPAKKLPALGADVGTAWDGGAYDGVKRVYVGQAQDGISVVKFVYDKGTEDIVGAEHGTSTLLGFEELELDYPSEYITAVQGTYEKIFGSDATVINMLRFKTNKQTSTPFGLEAGTAFELKEEGHKIVGFHGKVSDLLHQLGVYVLPVTN